MQNWGAPLDKIRSTILNSTHRKLRRQKRRKRPKKFEKDTEEGISLRAGREKQAHQESSTWKRTFLYSEWHRRSKPFLTHPGMNRQGWVNKKRSSRDGRYRMSMIS